MLHDLDRVLLLHARMYRPDARLDSGAGRGPHARRRVAGTPPDFPPLPLVLTPTSKIPPPTTITTPHPHPTFTAPPPHPDLTAAQFAVTRNAVFLVWHLFPIVWALAAADAISVEVEHMGCVPHVHAHGVHHR